MRSRLLVSAAILAAGVAMASGQHAPSGAGHDRGAHNSGRHTQGGAAGSQQTRTGARQNKGAERHLQESHLPKPQRAAAKRPAEPSHGDASPRQRNTRSGLLTPARHNETPLPRSARDRGTASERSILDRAMARGRLQPEAARSADDRRRHARGAPASAAAGEHGRAKDHARSQAAHRRPEQSAGRTDGWDLRGQARKVESRKVQGARSAPPPARRDAFPAGQADVRKAQTALNKQGFNVGDPDGKLGQRTKKALIAFQKQHGVQTSGKVDRATLQALDAGSGAQESQKESQKESRKGNAGNNSSEDSANKDGVHKGGSRVRGQAPAAAPRSEPAAPSTTGQEGAAPASPQPAEAETPPAPIDSMQIPDASSRVPAGAPQQDYKDDSLPSEDQR